MLPSAACAEDPPAPDVKHRASASSSRSRLANIDDMDDLLSDMLKGCTELLGYPHAFVMLLDETGKRLYTVASIGFSASGAGSEVRLGEGLIGVAAAQPPDGPRHAYEPRPLLHARRRAVPPCSTRRRSSR